MAIPAFAIGLILLSVILTAYLALVVSMLWAKRSLRPNNVESKAYEGIRVGARVFALCLMFPLLSAIIVLGIEDYYYSWRSWALYALIASALAIIAMIGFWLKAVFVQVEIGDTADSK